MDIEISIPDDLAHALTAEPSRLPQLVLEALALEGYRIGRLSEYQVQRLLGMDSRLQVHSFLKQHDVPLNYSLQDLRQDIETSRSLETASLEGTSNAA